MFTVSKERWLLISGIQGFQSIIMHINLSHQLILIYLHAIFFSSFYTELATDYLLYRAAHINFAKIPQIMCITSKDPVLGFNITTLQLFSTFKQLRQQNLMN